MAVIGGFVVGLCLSFYGRGYAQGVEDGRELGEAYGRGVVEGQLAVCDATCRDIGSAYGSVGPDDRCDCAPLDVAP